MSLAGGDDRSPDFGNARSESDDGESDGGLAEREGFERLERTADQPFCAEGETEDAAQGAGSGSQPAPVLFPECAGELVREDLLDFAGLRCAAQVPDDVDGDSRQQYAALCAGDQLVADHPGEEAGDEDQNREVDPDDFARSPEL